MNGRIVIGIGAVTAAALAVAAGIIEAAGQNLQQPQPPYLSNDIQKVRVIASFFPLYDFAKNVGGDRAEVSVMVPAGIEPHNWEPTPRDIADAENADMIVYNGAGFERWVSDINAKFAVDTSIGIQLMQGAEEGVHEESGLDPHIWLDPVLAKQQVEAIRDGFVQIDPVNSGYYHQNAQRYIAELDSLDSFIRSNLSNCELRDFIAFHNAFSYFANRYNLTQHSIQGISPEGDVLPQRIQEIKDLAATLGINEIYAEDLIDPRLANVIAGEIPNGQVLVLSPIEGLKREEIEQGLGYIDKMREDVQNLKVGLKCL
ncbi:MAG: zinc ABC transporter substrate-binding protein [Thermoproteota archaeon]|nr:zinc ABC transporter substrate-binding protein [Thermoproteota archaeon]